MKNVELILKSFNLKYLLKHTFIIFTGFSAITCYALVDLHFIGKIGSDELAASNFAAFPISSFIATIIVLFYLHQTVNGMGA